MSILNAKVNKAVAEYIGNGFNKTKTYQAVHPNAKYNTANQNADKFIVKYDIEKKAIEVLESHPKLNQTAILKSLEDDIDAERAIVVDKNIEYVRDNSNILEAKKTILKLYGLLGNSDGESKDNTNIQVNIDNITFNSFNKAIDKLKAISNNNDINTQTGEVIDAEVLED